MSENVTAPGGIAPLEAIAYGTEGGVAQAVDLTHPLPVSPAVSDGGDVALGAKADGAWSGSGAGSLIAIAKALWTALTGTVNIAPPPSIVAGGTITRPANTTAYASGQLVANSTTAASVTPVSIALGRVNGGTGCIRRLRLSTNKTGLAGNEVFRAHLFKNDPSLSSGIANGDGGQFSVNGVAAIHIGYADVTLDRVFRDGSKGIGTPAAGSEITFDCNSGVNTIYALLEARGAYTPASGEVLTIAVEAFRD